MRARLPYFNSENLIVRFVAEMQKKRLLDALFYIFLLLFPDQVAYGLLFLEGLFLFSIQKATATRDWLPSENNL